MKPFNKSDWDNLWKSDTFNLDSSEAMIEVEKERCSVRWRRIQQIILKQFGSFQNLRVIEIGAGRGTVALLMAQEGALVTLLDSSQEALKQARVIFGAFNAQADFVYGDLFQLPQEQIGQYDISMSFGLTEHFLYPERQKVVDIHGLVLKGGGLLFMAVPNKWSPSFQIYKAIAKALRKWRMGLEVSFTRQELRRNIRRAGLHYITVVGSSWTADMDYFVFSNILREFRRVIPIAKRQGQRAIRPEKQSWLDAYIGASLVVVGQR